MSCVNCGKSTYDYADFCEECNIKMEEMANVDVNEDTKSATMDTNRSIFFQKQSTSGNLLDEDPTRVHNLVKHSTFTGQKYWIYLFSFAVLMAIIFVSSR